MNSGSAAYQVNASVGVVSEKGLGGIGYSLLKNLEGGVDQLLLHDNFRPASHFISGFAVGDGALTALKSTSRVLGAARAAERGLAGGTFDVVGDSSRLTLSSPRLAGFENVEGTIVSGRSVHPNSLDYVGDTHVYAIRGPDGSLYKIGESTQGVRVGDGASIRAEQQARQLFKETGDVYRTEVRANFGNKADARAYETRFIQTYTRLYGRPPGNPLDR